MEFKKFFYAGYVYAKNFLHIHPVPMTLSYNWNFGVYALICLGIQLVTGLLMNSYYGADTTNAFANIEIYVREVPEGYLTRYIHANGASMFFIAVYIHMFRGIFYGSFQHPRIELWLVGFVLLVLLIATAFMGYVLPWGQMSFWAATVITQLFSVIPFIGPSVVNWLWGGFSLGDTTLRRLYTFHFLLPFVIALLSFIHINLLHKVGSNNPLGSNLIFLDHTLMFPYFIIKDLLGILLFLSGFCFLVGFYPNALMHPDNYIPANPMVTPLHIVPEWYFLWLYAILRCIPHKVGGVIGLAVALIFFAIMPWLFTNQTIIRSVVYKFSVVVFILAFLTLTKTGRMSPDFASLLTSRIALVVFFNSLFLGNFFSYIQGKSVVAKNNIEV